VNIARGLTTSQSSTPFLLSAGIPLTSSLAVDGNKDPNVYHGSCISTNMSDANPWMSIDFGKPINVTGLSITNEILSCGKSRAFAIQREFNERCSDISDLQ
jgi:hypothetical protein